MDIGVTGKLASAMEGPVIHIVSVRGAGELFIAIRNVRQSEYWAVGVEIPCLIFSFSA